MPCYVDPSCQQKLLPLHSIVSPCSARLPGRQGSLLDFSPISKNA